MASVEFRHITKRYAGAEAPAVDDFNLEVKDGEFLVLVGPSGCGKSTTLRIAAGLETPSSGRVLIGGRDVTSAPPRERDIAMVFQNYALYPHMTVAENMGFALKLRKTAKAEIARRVAETARTLGLEGLLDRLPKALSGGQRQRVALGRAIVRNPAVFLFDEPLSNLDARMRVEMRAEIVRLHRKLGSTMIYVTHDQVEAMTMGDRIVVMKDGVMRQAAPPIEVYEHPADPFTASFIGTPPMNLFPPGTLEEGFTVGFRPERIRLRPEAPEEPAASSAALAGTVDFAEALGSETLVHVICDAAALPVAVRIVGTSEVRFAPGMRVRLEPEAGAAVKFPAHPA